MLNKDSFIKLMRMAASVRETSGECKSLHSTTHWNLENCQVSCRIQIFTNATHSYVTKLFVLCQTQQYC